MKTDNRAAFLQGALLINAVVTIVSVVLVLVFVIVFILSATGIMTVNARKLIQQAAQSVADKTAAPELEKPGAAPAAQPAGINEARDKFAEALAEAEADADNALAQWREDYLGALAQFDLQRQQAGDFAGWNAARAERDRFEQTRSLPPAMATTGFADLDRLRERYHDLHESISPRKSRMILEARDKYEAALDALVTSYTIAGDHESANMAFTERETLKALREINGADMPR